MTVAEKIIKFNKSLKFNHKLPNGIQVMNPFSHSNETLKLSSLFYKKYYSDDNPRIMILGINPGKNGAGVTGVPFSDTKRLSEFCDINFSINSHEPSSSFIYQMINSYGGVKKFYSKYYINSLCPLGFICKSEKGNIINYNYYDNKELEKITRPFIIESLQKQIKICKYNGYCFCLGEGKNFKYFNNLNKEIGLFKKIIPLPHPRFIIQYRIKKLDEYITLYLRNFCEAEKNNN